MQVKSFAPPTIRLYPPLWSWQSILSILLSLAGLVFPASAFSAPQSASPLSTDKDVLYVDCGSSNTLINSINRALASLNPSEDNTVYVHGACRENVAISGFDRLQLIAQNGASISDASGDSAPALSIDNSTRVSVQGFTINGNGPNAQTEAIDCTFSYCAFSGNTVQGGSDGVDVFRGARASFQGDVLQNNNNGAGIFVGQHGFVLAIGVTSKGNGQGANVAGGFLQINSSTVQNNFGLGIVVRLGGTVNMFASTVAGNGGNGINVVGHSTFQLGFGGNGGPGSSITNNSGAGIMVKDLSFANFPDGVTNVVKSNLGGTDVVCSPQFPATRGALTNIGGGTTNCVEP
ncbi:MAG TPA: right-handed parallel beta-helix repeat-containing protein [Candidatus Acidoferrales bacterium]|nr:right-handed parallel beta-helix repeat-containing protein [Candidatus Acidoferrales bacterium]